jgi:hypothetical protein
MRHAERRDDGADAQATTTALRAKKQAHDEEKKKWKTLKTTLKTTNAR